MGAKRALIVDDSKSARTFLARILEKYDIEVDSAESAEEAIEYLGTHRPDVIFMDHLMPGMDGFQAVQAIKNNPRTATIPIMMYTSQEGELYLGQARALGAVGVLPKQIKPADVSKVLYQLHLLPDRRTGEQTSFRAVGADASGSSAEAGASSGGITVAALREQFAELRRALVANIDSQSDRITADIRALLLEVLPPPPPPSMEPPPPVKRRRPWGWIAAGIATAVAVASTAMWWREYGLRQGAVQQLAEARRALEKQQSASAERNAAVGLPAPRALPAPARTASAASVAAGPTAADPETQDFGFTPAAPVTEENLHPVADSSAPEPPLSKVPPFVVARVPYGTDPLGGPRLEFVRQVLERLAAEGYRGIVEVRTYAGRFCLVGNATEGYSLAPDEMPFSRCDIVGNPHDEALTVTGPRIPLPFANLIGQFRNATQGAMDVQVSAGDSAVTAVPYPQVSENLAAGEWNRAASANNRVEIHWR